MWISTLDLSPRRVLLTRLLGRFWRGTYFSSFAPLRVRNIPRQQLPGAGWVRVRNRLAGICGSDLHLIYADGDLRVAPAALPGHSEMYLGHEVVGEILEIGDDVHRLHVGDRVVLQHNMNCVAAGVQPLCRSCAMGNYGLCERGMLPGPRPLGGGWSEEMLLHEQQLFPIPGDMTDEQAVLLEPTSVALHAVLRHLPRAGDRVLIIGAGTIGLLTLQVLRALAPEAEISVLARYPFQIEKATRMGAAHIIYPQDSYSGVQQATQAQLYKGMLGNRMLLGGYDVIYDTVGSKTTLHNALRWARARATIVLVGLSLHMMQIDLTPIWYQEINLIGTLGQGMETWPSGTNSQRSTFSIATDLITQGILHPEQLITHRFALNNYRQALMTAMDRQQQRAIKIVFDYALIPPTVVPNVRASARHRRPATVGANQMSVLTAQDLAEPQKSQVPSRPLQSLDHPVTPMPIVDVLTLDIPTPPATKPQEPDELDIPAPPSPTQADVSETEAAIPAASPSVPLPHEGVEPPIAINTTPQPSVESTSFFEYEALPTVPQSEVAPTEAPHMAASEDNTSTEEEASIPPPSQDEPLVETVPAHMPNSDSEAEIEELIRMSLQDDVSLAEEDASHTAYTHSSTPPANMEHATEETNSTSTSADSPEAGQHTPAVAEEPDASEATGIFDEIIYEPDTATMETSGFIEPTYEPDITYQEYEAIDYETPQDVSDVQEIQREVLKHAEHKEEGVTTSSEQSSLHREASRITHAVQPKKEGSIRSKARRRGSRT